MAYWNKICGFVIVFFLFAFCVCAQTVKNPVLHLPFLSELKIPSSAGSGKNQNNNSAAPVIVNTIMPNYYTQHFGFVCKKELALQKAIKAPLYIRLGSLQQCNYLEGKK
jgi:hypothetical protein